MSSEFNLALHEPSWQRSRFDHPKPAVGVDGDAHTRVATTRGVNLFFAVGLQRYIYIESAKIVIMQQGINTYTIWLYANIQMFLNITYNA